MPDTGQSLALFVDFENLALGFAGTRKRFEIEKVLDRLLTKGKILVKKAYADWTRFGDYRRELHEVSIELIEIPKRSQVGKNSADIRLCVDALDLCYSKAHLDTFCILSGDSDFSPLVSKLRENGKHVIGVGMKASTSNLLVEGCDEFIYYEDIERNVAASAAAPVVAASANPLDKKAEALQLVMDTVQALKREGKDVLWGSLVKDTIRRRKPQFDESYYGYKSWSDILEDAQRRGLMSLTIDTRSGTYVISNFSPTGGLTPVPVARSSAPVREFPRDGGRRDPARDDRANREAADRAAREQATREQAERASRELAEREAKDSVEKAAREAAELEAAGRAAAARAAAEQLPADHAAAVFLSLPAAAEPAPPAHIPAEETPAETGAETPAEPVPAEEAASSTEAGSAEPTPAAEAGAEAPKKGVRRRGRAAVRGRVAAKGRVPKRREGE